MKKKLLKNMGVLILSTMLLATVGCGDKKTDDVAATEQITVTELPETAEPETEATEVAEETEEPTEMIVPETETEQAAAYTVTDMSATKYAKSSVNVRKGPSSDYEKLGGLGTNQKVTVTGQADTGWYRIEYKGEIGFVSDKYLVDEKVAANTSGANASGSNAATGTGNTGTAAAGGSTDANASGSTGTSGNSGNTSGSNTTAGNASTDSIGNASGAGGSTDTSGSTGNTDTNTSTDAGSSAGTSTGTSGSTDTSGSSAAGTVPEGTVIDPNTGMTIPDDVVIEDWGDVQGGADDGSGLSGGSSTWY